MTAPITIQEFWKYPGLPKNTELAPTSMQALLDKSWDILQTFCNQPLSLTTSNNEIRQHNTMYCNTYEEVMTFLPKFFPVVEIKSIAYSKRANGPYIELPNFVNLERKILIDNSPFKTGEYGFIKTTYTHGYEVIPDDLISALCMLTNHLLSADYFPTTGGIAEGNLMPAWMPQEVEQIICKYRRNR